MLIGLLIIIGLNIFGGNAASSKAGALFSGSLKAVEVEKYLQSDDRVKVSINDNVCFFDGEGDTDALIFYPGAKVEYTAYAELMFKLAENGMDCFLVKMPLDYAFLNSKKADEIISDYSYQSWNLAGHSLGGAIIASYAASTSNKIDGLYLLAAYPTKDVRSVDDILYIYGENDKVLNISKVESSKQYAPDNYREYVIEGGNHAQFGAYGEQSGDGEATISAREQINQTVEQILKGKILYEE